MLTALHIVPMALSCLIKEEKAKLVSLISKASSETQYNNISIPIMGLFFFYNKKQLGACFKEKKKLYMLLVRVCVT